LFPHLNENASVKKFPLTAVLLLFSACSSDKAGESLQGIWNTESDVTIRNLFDGNTWEIDILGAYDEGGKPLSAWGLQVESGTFTQTGNTVNFSALLTSSWVADSRGRKTFTDGKPGWEAAARRS
jgi:hypothetical protein